MANTFNYWEKELQGIMTTGLGDAVQVKFSTYMTKTKWLSLRPEEFEAVEALLIELYAKRLEEES